MYFSMHQMYSGMYGGAGIPMAAAAGVMPEFGAGVVQLDPPQEAVAVGNRVQDAPVAQQQEPALNAQVL